ncbi:hypothetical protein [Streptomyces sp. NPDC056670]|uniref:hypothetical protein n=1 Tax=Streptomyces sp. NPDC056670 TaxID=3345904 RepID=UPI0036BE8EDB
MLYEQNDEVDEILARYGRPLDPENCTEDDLALLLGRNWRDVVVIIRQAAELTYDQAEKIIKRGHTSNWELHLDEAHDTLPRTGLGDWGIACDAMDDAGGIDGRWLQFDDFNAVYDAFICATTAAMAGDLVPELTHRDLMWTWRSAL